jgi:prepilin-type N-terminal cleavage/methylation domain-containing protein
MARWHDSASVAASERAPVLTVGTARTRRGVTLAELLVALTLSGLVLGTATTSLLRQQRTAVAVGGTTAVAAQLRAATGALAGELAPLERGSGDLVPDEASDTTLGLRTLVTSGASCDDAVGSATFAPEAGEPYQAGGLAPRMGDSLWWYAGAASGWHGRIIVASDSVNVPCMLAGGAVQPSRRVQLMGTDSIPFGAFLRVTRRSRYAFYRSGDGSWQLGLQEWVPETARLAPPQPVAGPFVMRRGLERSGFRYFDQGGAELLPGQLPAEIARVARIRVTVLMRGGPAGAGAWGLVRDSVDVALQASGAP